MKKLKGRLLFETKNDLKLDFESKNFGTNFAGWDKSQTEIEIELETKKKDVDDLQIEDFLQVQHDEENNRIKVKTINEEQAANLKIFIHAPHSTNLNIDSQNAPFRIKDFHKDLKLNLVNGPLKIKKIRGDIEVRSINGPVSIKESQGDLDLGLKNGPCKISDQNGAVKIASKNGSIKVINSQGKLSVQSENGSIKVLGADFSQAELNNGNGEIFYVFKAREDGDFSFINQKGRIQLIIPESLPYNISAANKLGRFHIGLEGEYDSKESEGIRSVTMTRGAGTVKIKAENKLGSINLVHGSNAQRGFDIPDIDTIMENIPEGFDKEKIEKKVRKGLKKIRKIKIPDIGNIVNDAMQEVQSSLKDAVHDLEDEGADEKVKNKISNIGDTIVSEVKKRYKEKPLKETEKEVVNERSRLKILKMLEEGKITAKEAEKLIEALEE